MGRVIILITVAILVVVVTLMLMARPASAQGNKDHTPAPVGAKAPGTSIG